MAYTREIGKEFWYEFDNQTLWQRTPEINDALFRAYFQNGMGLSTPVDELRTSYSKEDHPAPFEDRLQAGAEGFVDLAELELAIIESHLEEPDDIRSAFEDFGQGVLHDSRAPRPVSRHIHMMDGSPDDWVGYHRWYASIRASVLFGSPEEQWLHIARCMALAWAIQTEADPEIDNPDNPGLPEERLEKLRHAWMALPWEQLDWAFVTHQFRAPSLEAVCAVCLDEGGGDPAITYQDVQSILDEAAGPFGQPFHGGAHRFWLLPYDEFLQLPPVYGHPLIAEPGPDRGERSALVKVLKAGDDGSGSQLEGVPRMPLNSPTFVSDENIQLIQDWIDVGMPE